MKPHELPFSLEFKAHTCVVQCLKAVAPYILLSFIFISTERLSLMPINPIMAEKNSDYFYYAEIIKTYDRKHMIVASVFV